MTNVLSSGSFTSTGAAFNLAIESGFDHFEMFNITDMSTATLQAAANTNVMHAEFVSQMAGGSAMLNLKTSGAATWAATSMIATNGFTLFDNGNPPVFAVGTLTGITAASPAVVAATAHGLVVGDTVRLTNVNGTMQIMSGLTFSVIAVGDANHFTISFDSSGTAIGGTPATSGNFQKVIPNPFDPQNDIIGPTTLALIVGGTGGSLQLALNNVPAFINGGTTYQVGAKLRVVIPNAGASVYGPTAFTMPSSVVGTISAITAQTGYNSKANLIELSDIVLPATPALVYPAGSAGAKFSYPFVSDIAEKATILTEAEDNKGIRGITIGTGVQTTGKLYQWIARKGYVIV